MDYVARPGQPETLHCVRKREKSNATAKSTMLAVVIQLIGAFVFELVYLSTTENIFMFGAYFILFSGFAFFLVSMGFAMRASYFERQLKPHLQNDDVLTVDTSVAERWRGERKSDQRIDENDLYTLQERFNSTFAQWRQNLSAGS